MDATAQTIIFVISLKSSYSSVSDELDGCEFGVSSNGSSTENEKTYAVILWHIVCEFI